jgi:competence protein ComEA
MRQWLEQHRETYLALLIASLVFAVALGTIMVFVRRPQPAPIVIRESTPLPMPTRFATPTPEPVQVYVSGAVVHPGVYAVPWDCRVEGALQAAGGAETDADLVQVNLAQRVYDEQQVHVPRKGETALPSPLPPAKSVGGVSGTKGRKLNINTASVTELDVLPGIGLTLGQRIVDYRQAHGPFARVEDIKLVKGIGESVFEDIKDVITVE